VQMRGEQALIARLVRTEIALLESLRDGSGIMQHMEDFYYVNLLKVRPPHEARQVGARQTREPPASTRTCGPSGSRLEKNSVVGNHVELAAREEEAPHLGRHSPQPNLFIDLACQICCLSSPILIRVPTCSACNKTFNKSREGRRSEGGRRGFKVIAQNWTS
jgi:hypothetical protein